MEILPQLPPPPPPPPPPPSPLLRTCGERHRPRELRSRGGGLGSQAVPPSASLAVAAAKSCHWEKDGAVTCLPRPRRGGRAFPQDDYEVPDTQLLERLQLFSCPGQTILND
ncbi:E3 ubiquitin-protein ligase MARCHF11-like isoform X2 [Artibeus jamaicensis]|uniref:E3 ubiquitin-protein ligase MARCHF11-like isoform X2 n=1 Tax=Artibeus jamaicensis TaxID=9417 RepID=UPI00235AAF26|nr:E3 ubiquitin-protein ligase MARCHF11-like isoform X2 [Artibeus jamaicensis]